jgi:REP element-mobilizing transposase RayT
MTSHVHLVFRSAGEYKPEDLLGDFKRVTSRKIIQVIIENPKESRKE